MAADVSFAVTAVLAVRADKDFDLFAALVLGFITAVGGGTIRDVIIDAPVFWGKDLAYVWVALGASAAAFYGRKLFTERHIYSLMLYVDGLGAAMFGIQAVAKVWDLDFGVPVAPVILGVVTAIGGGLIRHRDHRHADRRLRFTHHPHRLEIRTVDVGLRATLVRDRQHGQSLDLSPAA